MPSSSAKKTKDLYVSSTGIAGLNKLAEIDVPTDRNANAKLFCKSADKVFLKAQDYYLEGDEENAYVFYMRYFNIVTIIKKSKQYQDNKKFYNELLGTSKAKTAISRAEELVSSLTKRFGAAEEEAKEKAKEEAKKKKQQEEEEKSKAKSGKSSNGNAINGHHNRLNDDSSLGIGSSVDVYQRLHVNHSSILQPQAPNNGPDTVISSLESPGPLISGLATRVPSLSALELYKIMKSTAPSKLLILDVRSRAEFLTNHIQHASCISIPAELLEQGVSVSNIERRLAEKTRVMWTQRGSKDYVVILDKSTKVTEMTPQNQAQQLKDAIYKFDAYCSVRKEPLFLDGGFDSWLWHYPSLAVKPDLPKVTSQASTAPQIDLSTLDFPDLPTEDETKEPTTSEPGESNPDTDEQAAPPASNIYPHNPQAGNNSNLDTAASLPQQDARRTLEGGVSSKEMKGNALPPRPETMGSHQPGPDVSQSRGSFPSQTPMGGQRTMSTPHHSTNKPGLPNGNQAAPPVVSSTQPGVALPKQAHANHRSTIQQPEVPRLEGQGAVLPGQLQRPPTGTTQQIRENIQPVVAGSASSGSLSPGLPVPSASSVSAVDSAPRPASFTPPSPGSPHQAGLSPQSSATAASRSNLDSPMPSSPSHVTQSVPGQVTQHMPVSNQTHVTPSVPSDVRQPTPGQHVPQSSAPSQVTQSLPSQGLHVVSKPNVAGQNARIVPGVTQSVSGRQFTQSGAGRVTPSGHNTARSIPNQPPGAIPQQQQRQPQIQAQPQQQQPLPPQTQPNTGHTLPNYPGPLQHPPRSMHVPHGSTQNLSGAPASQTRPVVQPGQTRAQLSNSNVKQMTLPPGWQQRVTPGGKAYFIDHNTKTTHWTLPVFKANQPEVKPQSPLQNQPQPSGRKGTSGETPAALKKASLRRSLSSPNLAKLADQGPRPEIDRSSKPEGGGFKPPIPIINRSAKPLSSLQLDHLNPAHGGIGRGLTGLRNLGNTCYMNSVIQCLSSTAPLADFFVSGGYYQNLNKENPHGSRGELTEQFSVVIRVLHLGQFKFVSPGDFKRTVGKFKPAFAGYDQQDSQELLAFLMDGLHEDINRIKRKPYLKAPGDSVPLELAAKTAWENHKKRNDSFFVELFDGLFKSTMQCLSCRKESATFETFSSLTLPLPSHTSHCSLQDCLNIFTKPEKLSGDDKWFCPRCGQRREATKRIQVWRLPPILIVHLKRFQYEGMWRQKLQTSVSFPMDKLNMSDYVVGPGGRPETFSLYAVSNHYGTMHGGHYTAFCKNVYNRRSWYKFDDQYVSEISPREVVTSAAYLLFYTSFDFEPPRVFLR